MVRYFAVTRAAVQREVWALRQCGVVRCLSSAQDAADDVVETQSSLVEPADIAERIAARGCQCDGLMCADLMGTPEPADDWE